MKKIIVLGCTGSIGSQTLDIVRNMKNDFSIVGLSAGHNKKELEKLCNEFNCKGTLYSEEGILGIEKLVSSCDADIAINGIAGAAGLKPSVLVLQAGMDLALANKETVVMAWPIVKKIAKEHKANIIPVDSEHSAIFSLLNQTGEKNIDEIIITASGGPFREFSDEQLNNVTVEQALHHPTWNMGKKITIDSSTLANKGLEVIEACRLFNVSAEKVKVVVHPQSLIHSLVRTKNGMLYAQISNPDMRHPIFDALTWPEIKGNYLEPFNLAGNSMTFFPPRLDSFPLLKYAYECARKSNCYTIAFNAANEIAVNAFIEKKCTYQQISQIVNEVLQDDWSENPDSLEKIYSADKKSRNKANSVLVSKNGGYGCQ
ncbi:MAG: 1-deoxy-D-xylulose-5-phosphate reductoisomerase [Treponema sp.]|nr:1-deoxy-D-xylulose-5-phosphate reductoisomerase [Treponema sp.]